MRANAPTAEERAALEKFGFKAGVAYEEVRMCQNRRRHILVTLAIYALSIFVTAYGLSVAVRCINSPEQFALGALLLELGIAGVAVVVTRINNALSRSE